jgi:hypothetical protein
MARIPNSDALGEPQISAGRGGDIDTSSMRAFAAQGQAVANAGHSLEKIGAVIGEQQRQDDDYEVRKQFIDLDLETEKQLDEAKRSASGDADGFTEGLRKAYDERARGFFANVPGHLKPKYDELLVARGAQFEKRAYDHEIATRDKFHIDDLNGRFDTLYGATADRPDTYRENIARGVSLIDASRVPAVAKLRMKRTFAEEIERLHAEKRLDADPEKVLDDLKRFPRGLLPQEESPSGRMGGQSSMTGPRQPFAKPVEDAIAAAATKAGVDIGTLRTFAKIESGGDPGNVTGSYKGLFQLSNEEFRKYGGSGDILDPAANAEAAAQKLKVESQQLEKQHGRPPTVAELYMVHQQGTAGSAAHWKNPDKPAWENMLSTGEGRQKGEGWAKQAIWGNIPNDAKRRFGTVDNVTSRDFVNLWEGKVAALGGPARASAAAAAVTEPQSDPEPEFAEGRIPTGEVKVAEASGAAVKTDASPTLAGTFEEHDEAPYRHLSPKARRALIYKAETNLRAGVEKTVGDDIERLRRTGLASTKDGEESSLDRAKRLMRGAPQQYAKLEAQWKEAEMEYKAISPLMTMPTDAAREAIGKIVSSADDNSDSYRAAVRVQKKAEAVFKKIEDLRTRDAAQSVSGYKDDADRFPPLQNTKNVMMILGGPNRDKLTPQQAHDMLFQARLADQMTINPGKPYEHRIVTAREAEKLLQMPSPSTLKPREYRDRLEEAAARAEQWYGSKWSERALKEAIALQRGARNDELKQYEAKILARVAQGRDVDPADQRRLNELQDLEKQRSGWSGRTDADALEQSDPYWRDLHTGAPPPPAPDAAKAPNRAQADWLMADPEKRSAVIDKHFGAGAAAKIIGAAQKKQTPAPAR